MRPVQAILALSLGLSAVGAHAAANLRVVELFTSQGCSSCPPADQLLGELAGRDDVLALAYHVDYWDRLGWKDPFASAAATDRQRRYGQALGLRGIYTPQMVIDGVHDVVGSDRGGVAAALKSHQPGLPIALTRDGQAVSLTVPAQNGGRGDLWLLAYSRAAETKVPRGENAGKTLKEYAIVRSVTRLGGWDGTAQTRTIALSDLPADADSLAVLLQSPGQGAILAAAALTR